MLTEQQTLQEKTAARHAPWHVVRACHQNSEVQFQNAGVISARRSKVTFFPNQRSAVAAQDGCFPHCLVPFQDLFDVARVQGAERVLPEGARCLLRVALCSTQVAPARTWITNNPMQVASARAWIANNKKL